MVNIFIIFRVQHFHRVQITGSDISDIFNTFRVHQVQLKRVPLNGNKKIRGDSGVPRGLKKVCKVRLGKVRLGKVRLGKVRLGKVRLGKVRLGKVR